jgi:hypothetical protein
MGCDCELEQWHTQKGLLCNPGIAIGQRIRVNANKTDKPGVKAQRKRTMLFE